jgi:uncharacterized membrane protein/ketosteroid isomerase-like protein
MAALLTSLILAAFLCSLVAGFLFAFAVVVMPGIRSLNDRDFLRAFQAMDCVIQNNQPVFMLVWVGSVVALIAAAALGIGQLDGLARVLLVAATLAYLLGVQGPTVAINVPLNNRLKALAVDALDDGARRAARQDFEPRWNRSNVTRAVLASVASGLLIVLVGGGSGGVASQAETPDTTTDLAVLLDLNRDYIRSVQNSDVERFQAILAEDFRCSNPDGSIVDKAGFLAQTAQPVTITGLEAQDVEVRIMGDVAIVHARTSYAAPDGRARSGRYTDVWARRNGRWLAVSAHVTRGS